MVKLQENKEHFFLTLPRQLIKQKGWGKGQDLLLLFNERGNIEITDKMR